MKRVAAGCGLVVTLVIGMMATRVALTALPSLAERAAWFYEGVFFASASFAGLIYAVLERKEK